MPGRDLALVAMVEQSLTELSPQLVERSEQIVRRAARTRLEFNRKKFGLHVDGAL